MCPDRTLNRLLGPAVRGRRDHPGRVESEEHADKYAESFERALFRAAEEQIEVDHPFLAARALWTDGTGTTPRTEGRDGWMPCLAHVLTVLGGVAEIGGPEDWSSRRSATYSSKRPVASRSRSYRLVSGNGGNQDSRRTIQLS